MQPGPYLLRGLLGAIAIVGVGVALSGSEAEGAETTITGSRFESVAVGSGIRHRVDSSALERGEAKAVMGGLSLDLRGAEIAGEEASIDVGAVFGRIELRVPEDWRVETRVGAVVFGGVENRARVPESENAKRLLVRGNVVFGALDVSN
jgi:predicted membrane protein